MKYKRLIIATAVFFLIINTSYFWVGKFGLFAMPAFFVLGIVYFGLAIIFLKQLLLAIREKFSDKPRIAALGLMTFVLIVTFFFPFGFINFDKLSGNDLLVAQREGAANCTTTLKLKDNDTFIEKNVCFGITEIKGNYRISNDTIYFEKVNLGRHENEFYQFAVIRPSNVSKDKKHFDLVRFKDSMDTIGHELWIVKNDLPEFTHKRTAIKLTQ